MDENNKIGRRKIIKGIGAGLTALTVSPVFARTKVNSEYFSVNDLEDPTTKYPKPPFKSQSQPWPGLAGKMEPRPDHGDKSH